MDAKEKVKQGLQARKDVRAAEARAEKLREDLTAANDARFRDQMNHRKDEIYWQSEREILVGIIYRQREVIRKLREEKEFLVQKEYKAQQRQAMLGATKAILVFLLLVCLRNLGWIVPNLAASLLAGTVLYLFFAVVSLARNK